MSQRIPSPLKWPGGKHYMAPKIWEIAKRVPHVHRVEPYAGSLAFTLASDPENYSEVANDLNSDLGCFWQCMRNDKEFAELKRRVEATPFSDLEWKVSEIFLRPASHRDVIETAVAFFIRCRQSLCGRMDAFTPISRNRTRGGMNEQVSAWLTAIEGLPEVHARLKRVLILNQSAELTILEQDGDNTLYYLDPPYVHATRTEKNYYRHEMSNAEHESLLALLSGIKGKFLLSGYPCSIYDQAAEKYGWHRTDFDLPNNLAGGKTKRRMTECVWTNFAPSSAA